MELNVSLWKTWVMMIVRCFDEGHRSYPNYGGRGITVCDEWINSYVAFTRDMGPKPGRRYSIERMDNNGNYCPENCKWATAKEQARNRRSSRNITAWGQTKTIAEWIESYGISHSAVSARLRAGWTAEDALSVPKRKAAARTNKLDLLVEYDGQSKSVREWLEEKGINKKCFNQRSRNPDWTLAEAATVPMLTPHIGRRPSYVNPRCIPVTIDGETMTANQWADRLGIGRGTFKSRLVRNYSPEMLKQPTGAFDHIRRVAAREAMIRETQS